MQRRSRCTLRDTRLDLAREEMQRAGWQALTPRHSPILPVAQLDANPAFRGRLKILTLCLLG